MRKSLKWIFTTLSIASMATAIAIPSVFLSLNNNVKNEDTLVANQRETTIDNPTANGVTTSITNPNGFHQLQDPRDAPKGYVPMKSIITSELTNPMLSNIENSIKLAILDSKIFINLNPDPTLPEFSVNDFEIMYIDNTADNKNGYAQFNITILNNHALENGKPVPSLNIDNVLFGGFKQLLPAEIPNEIQLGNDVTDKYNMQQLLDNDVLLKQIICESINKTINSQMFPDWSTENPLRVDQIVIGDFGPLNGGTINVTYVLIAREWVNSTYNIVVPNSMPIQEDNTTIFKSNQINFTGLMPYVGADNQNDNRNWFLDNWWIIFVALIGVAAIGLLVVIIIRNIQIRKTRVYDDEE